MTKRLRDEMTGERTLGFHFDILREPGCHFTELTARDDSCETAQILDFHLFMAHCLSITQSKKQMDWLMA